MKLQITYHIAGQNSVFTPVDIKTKAIVDTTISNSLPFNTSAALSNFIKPIEIRKIREEIEYILRTKKINTKNTNIITKNIGMYIIIISVKAIN